MPDETGYADVLSEKQRARIACLTAARGALVARGFASGGKADPIELIDVARYIETGIDPYDRAAPTIELSREQVAEALSKYEAQQSKAVRP